MKRPNFFIIGAPKCGTTSLASWLSQHPQVFMSAFKEPHYFNTDSNFRFVNDETRYLDLFRQAGPEHIAVGESSTWYLFSQTAVSEIECFTDKTARYIVCLRNPVEVAPAVHAQVLFSGDETIANFEQAWHLQDARAQGRKLPLQTISAAHLQYRRACALGEQVERLLNTVPRDRIHFVFLDDIKKDAQAVFDHLQAFLGLLKPSEPVSLTVQNSAHRPRSLVVTRIIRIGSNIRRALGLKRGIGLLTRMRKANKQTAVRMPLDTAFEAELSRQFEPEVQKLEQLLNCDLSHWKAL
jgi:hypothetical protein